MVNRTLMKWGGVSAFLYAGLLLAFLVVSLPTYASMKQNPGISEWAGLVSGGAFGTAVLLWAVCLCLFVVVLAAVYDYLRQTDPGQALIGSAFVLIMVALSFTYVGLLTAARSIAVAAPSGMEQQLGVIRSLMSGLDAPLVWCIILLNLFWGFAFRKRSGRSGTAGLLMIGVGVIRFANYNLGRFDLTMAAGITGLLAAAVHILATVYIARALLAAAEPDEAPPTAASVSA